MIIQFLEKYARKQLLLERSNWGLILEKRLYREAILFVCLLLVSLTIVVVIRNPITIVILATFISIFLIYKYFIEDKKIQYENTGNVLSDTRSFSANVFTEYRLGHDEALDKASDYLFASYYEIYKSSFSSVKEINNPYKINTHRIWVRRTKKSVSITHARLVNRSSIIDTQFKHIILVLQTNYKRRKAMMPWIELTRRTIDIAKIENIIQAREQKILDVSLREKHKEKKPVVIRLRAYSSEVVDGPKQVKRTLPKARKLIRSDEALQHMRSLLDLYRKKSASLNKQIKIMGYDTPASILIEIEDVQKRMSQIERQMDNLNIEVKNHIRNDE